MMEIKENCIQTTNQSKIKCEEKTRKIIFNNPSRLDIEKIEVDGCQITKGERCDFLVRNQQDEYFIELKGGNIKKAFSQLTATIKQLGLSEANRKSYVISSKMPLNSTDTQNMKLKLKKQYKSELIIKNKSLEVNL